MALSPTVSSCAPSAERNLRVTNGAVAPSMRPTTLPDGSTPTRTVLRLVRDVSSTDVAIHATCAAGPVRVTGCGIGCGRTTLGDALALPDAVPLGAATPIGGADASR